MEAESNRINGKWGGHTTTIVTIIIRTTLAVAKKNPFLDPDEKHLTFSRFKAKLDNVGVVKVK